MIRLAEAKDAPDILAGAKDFISRVPFKHLMPQSDKELIQALGSLVDHSGFELSVFEHESQIVAGLGILYSPYLWNRNILVGEELFWWASDQAPFGAAYRLIKWVVHRAEDKGAILIFHKLPNSPQGVDRMYEQLGLTLIDTVYAQWA